MVGRRRLEENSNSRPLESTWARRRDSGEGFQWVRPTEGRCVWVTAFYATAQLLYLPSSAEGDTSLWNVHLIFVLPAFMAIKRGLSLHSRRTNESSWSGHEHCLHFSWVGTSLGHKRVRPRKPPHVSAAVDHSVCMCLFRGCSQLCRGYTGKGTTVMLWLRPEGGRKRRRHLLIENSALPPGLAGCQPLPLPADAGLSWCLAVSPQ